MMQISGEEFPLFRLNGVRIWLCLPVILLTRSFPDYTNVALENMHKLSNAMKAICEGEIDQYQHQYNLDISINTYLKRIARETALLLP